VNNLIEIDREKGANLISRWLDGKVTNHEFDDEWPYDSLDLGVADIGKELWLHYSDVRKKRLSVEVLSADEIALLKRCLLFLRCSEVYESTPREPSGPWNPGLLQRILGVTERPWEQTHLVVGPERKAWWPFAGEEQWRKATQRTGATSQ